MIQRIQTLFLFLAGLLLAGLFFYPLASFLTADQQVLTMYAFSIQDTADAQWQSPISVSTVGILLLVATLLAFVSIFLYKNRILQARFSMLGVLLTAIWPALVYFIAWLAEEPLKAGFAVEGVVVISWIAAVLLFMARRRILIDEALVKSYDRIR